MNKKFFSIIMILLLLLSIFTVMPSAARKALAVEAATISGPYYMTVKIGYAATSSDVFTITGDPVPTVEKISGNSKITWNDATKRLDIAPGLTGGTYEISIKASNSQPPTA